MKEVELKFQVPPHRRAALAAAVAGSSPARRTRLRATYWDTADRALARAGLALRVRQEGKDWVQTLKGAGDDGMTRLEHNVPLAAPAVGMAMAVPAGSALTRYASAPDPSLHAGTPPGDRLFKLLSDNPAARWQPQYRTDVLRRARTLQTRLGRVELAFDEGRITSGEGRLPVLELEIELLGSSPLAVIATARRWLPRFGLWLDTRSKAERGDLLARGQTMAPARPAQPVTLARGMSLRDAQATVLRSCADQVCTNASQVGSGQHTDEHVHQLRVGLRRLRCALALFRSDESDASLAEAATTMFRRLGNARDQAVLRGELASQLAAAWQGTGAATGAGGIREQTLPMGGKSPVEVVRSTASQILLLDLLARVVAGAQEVHAEPAPLEEALRRLNRWQRRAAQDAARSAELDDQGRHRLRKRIKRLRYGAEFLASLFAPRAVRRYLQQVCSLQASLGEMNDLALLARAHRAMPQEDAHRRFALSWLRTQSNAVARASRAEWEAFAKAQRFWKKC